MPHKRAYHRIFSVYLRAISTGATLSPLTLHLCLFTSLFCLFLTLYKSTWWWFVVGRCIDPNPIYLKTPDPSLIALRHDTTSRLHKPCSGYSDPALAPCRPHVCPLVQGKIPRHQRTCMQPASGCRPWGSYLSGTLLEHAGVERHCVQSGVSQRDASGCTLCLDSTVLLIKKKRRRRLQ